MDLFGDLELRNPWFLLAALTAIPVFLLARRRGGRVLFSSLRALPASASSWRAALAWVPDVLMALAAAALGLALAGPRAGNQESRVKSEGIAIVMAVDISSSMRALDLGGSVGGPDQKTRLDAVKEVFHDFVLGGNGLGGRPDDAIGLVSFARYADTRSPLTLDRAMIARIARELEIVTQRSEDGTALGAGLSMAVNRLVESKARSKVAILLTDGVSNAGEPPLAAANLAKESGIKVYTIGAGTNGMAPMLVENPFTGRLEPQSVPVQIDEDTLQQISKVTGGAYFRATDADGLRQVYRSIDALERTELDESRFLDYHEYYAYALALGLLLACLAWLLQASVFRRLP